MFLQDRPRTHETIQLKGAGASVAPLENGDAQLIRTYVESVVDEPCRLGYKESLVRAMCRL